MPGLAIEDLLASLDVGWQFDPVFENRLGSPNRGRFGGKNAFCVSMITRHPTQWFPHCLVVSVVCVQLLVVYNSSHSASDSVR